MAMDYMISRCSSNPEDLHLDRRKVFYYDIAHMDALRDVGMAALIRAVTGDLTCLPPEVEEGNIEYKVKLNNPFSGRMQRLISQMKWRLREGQGEAIYEIGVEDNGNLVGLTDHELEASLHTLRTMAAALDATTVTMSERDVTPKGENVVRRRVAEVLVRKVPDNQQFIEIRLAILGGTDVGKSTLCGVLSQGVLDDGNGKARLSLFRYLHEFQTGRTSSVCRDVIGFDSQGKVLNYADHSLEEIVELSTKLVTLIDLAGDRKYLKTTIYGLTGYLPHFAALVISAFTGPNAMTREHWGLAVALNIPVFVIITKVDSVSDTVLEKVIQNTVALFKCSGMNFMLKHVEHMEDVSSCASTMFDQNIVPMFFVSNVSGKGIDLLQCFLNVLPPSGYSKSRIEELSLANPLFYIEEVFRFPSVGVVVSGTLAKGVLSEGDRIQLGPDRNCAYHLGKVDTIRRNKQPVRLIKPGEAASVSILIDDQSAFIVDEIRKGMVVLDARDNCVSCRQFAARFYLLYHPSNEICIGFQATVYVGSVCQTATIVDMDAPSILPCVWVKARFEFYSKPEFVKLGTPLVFREGLTKGMGEVIELF